MAGALDGGANTEVTKKDSCSCSCDGCGCILALLLLCVVVFGVLGLRVSYKTIKVSWYNPALLGENCAVRRGDECISTTASGMPWQDGLEWSAACAPEYPFGTIFFAGSTRKWVCMDRGGAIKKLPGNRVWVDMLVEKPVYPFGFEVPGIFIWWRPIWLVL